MSRTRHALDMIFTDHCSRYEPGVFDPIRDALLTHGDLYMHLADLKSYSEAIRAWAGSTLRPRAGQNKAILNVAGSGKFSSDRTILEYARDIWGLTLCPVS